MLYTWYLPMILAHLKVSKAYIILYIKYLPMNLAYLKALEAYVMPYDDPSSSKAYVMLYIWYLSMILAHLKVFKTYGMFYIWYFFDNIWSLKSFRVLVIWLSSTVDSWWLSCSWETFSVISVIDHSMLLLLFLSQFLTYRAIDSHCSFFPFIKFIEIFPVTINLLWLVFEVYKSDS